MSLDVTLVAAATLRRQGVHGHDATDDSTFQLQLAHVLLDGGYDGVATIAEALEGGDHGLGTLDRLNGELVVVDGEPWQVDSGGVAHLVPGDALTPFVVVSRLEAPRTQRLRDCSREEVAAAVESLVHDPSSVVSVRLEGSFTSVLVRSVPPQTKPYRPYAEVCQSDEVRWELRPFDGVFVGFRFPDLSGGDTIPGLHLHGLSADRSTGGHNHDLHVDDAVLSVGVSHDLVVALPDRGMVDLLETPRAMRAVQRLLLRRGPRTAEEIAGGLGVTPAEAVQRLEWLADRGFVEEWGGGVAGLGGQTRWRMRLASAAPRAGWRASDLLTGLDAEA